jgi:hypothetical protein
MRVVSERAVRAIVDRARITAEQAWQGSVAAKHRTARPRFVGVHKREPDGGAEEEGALIEHGTSR